MDLTTRSPIFRAQDHYGVRTATAGTAAPSPDRTPRNGAPAEPPLPRSPLAPARSQWRGVDLGTLTHEYRGNGYRRTETDFVVGTGELYGLVGGFPRLDHALQAAESASAGERPAVAVLHGADGNYHLRGVRAMSLMRTQGAAPGIEGTGYRLDDHRFSRFDMGAHLAGRRAIAGETHVVRPGLGAPIPELAALVDGRAVQNA